MIPYGRQDINEDDIAAVNVVLRSDFLTQGPVVPVFENAICEILHARYAVAVCNATAALHIAYLALDLGPGDWLWTVPNTFVATANAALYCGASVDFVDIDLRTYTISIDALRSKLEQAERQGTTPASTSFCAIARVPEPFGNCRNRSPSNPRYGDCSEYSAAPVSPAAHSSAIAHRALNPASPDSENYPARSAPTTGPPPWHAWPC